MNILSRMLKHRAACPWCGVKFSRWGVMRGGRRRCGACGGVVRATEPANFLGSLIIGVLTAFLILVFFGAGLVIGLKSELGIWSLLIALLLAAQALGIGLTIGWLVWPYATPFHALPQKCLKCGYDLRATGRVCPECGCVQSSYRLPKIPIPKGEADYKTPELL